MPDIFDLIEVEDTPPAPAPYAGSQDRGDIFDMVAYEHATSETDDNDSLWSAAKRGARKVIPSFASTAASTAEAFLRSFGTTDPGGDLNEYVQNIDRLRPGYSQTPEGKRHIEEVKKSMASREPTAIEKTFDKLADIAGDSARHWDKKRQSVDAEKPKDLQRKLWGNLDLLKDPRWWTETGIDTASSLIPTLVAYAVGGPMAAGATGGSQEGSSLYRELVDEGVPEESARKASTAYGVVSGVLNSFGAEAVLGKRGIEKLAGRGIFKAIARRAVGGAGEAVTEYLEEPAQAASAALAKDKPMQEVVSDVVESLKNIDVIPTSFVLGAATNAMAPKGQTEQEAPEVLPPEQQPVTDESRMLPQPAIEVTPEGTAFTPEQKSNLINEQLTVPAMTVEQVTEAQRNISEPPTMPEPDPDRASNMGVIAERGQMAEHVHVAEPVEGIPQGARDVGLEPVTDPGRMLVNPFGMPTPSVQVSPEGVAMMPEQKSDLINQALAGMPESEIQKARTRLDNPEQLDALTAMRDKIAGNLLKKDGTPKKWAGARGLARLYALNEQISDLMPTTSKEAPASMEAQMRALVDGRKPAVLVTPGEAMPSVPEGFKTERIPEGTLIFSQEGTLNLARSGRLGSALGYGIDSKPQDSQTVVTARDKDGTVIQDVVTDGSQDVLDAAEAVAGEDGTVEVRPAIEAFLERSEDEQKGDMPGAVETMAPPSTDFPPTEIPAHEESHENDSTIPPDQSSTVDAETNQAPSRVDSLPPQAQDSPGKAQEDEGSYDFDVPAISRKNPQDQARLTKQQVLQTIGPIVQNWKNAPRIETVQSVKDLPSHLKDYIFSADPFEGACIDGVFDPKTGTIYLIADALTDTTRAQHVLLHEVVGHYGLRGLLGKNFKAILDQIGMVRRKDLRPIAARWGYDLNTPEGRRGAAEEWLAEIAGRGETNGFIRRTIAAIRDALRKMGFNLEYSDADLVELVAKARKYVEQGEAGTGSGGIKFSRAASAASPARIVALQAKADAMPDSAEKTSLMEKLQAMQGGATAPSATATTPQPASKHKAPAKTSAPGRLSAAVQPRLDYLRMKFQDKFIPLKRAQQALKKQGWQEREDNNPYLAEELSHGIAKDRLDRFEAEQIEPLMEEIKAAPVSLEELEQYLYARHAPERNAYIQKINPEFEEGGSGMTDAEATEIIDGFRKSGKLRVLHNLAQKAWAMAEMQRRIIREEGLEEQERLDAWEQFNFYVPLKGAPDGLDEGHGRSIGRGFAVTKSGTRAALGRRSEAENILAHLAAQVADTIVRAERAKVGKAFLQMVEENPDPSLWTVRTRDNLPTRQVLAKNPAFTALRGKLQRRQAALEKAEDGAEIERLQREIAEIRDEMEATPSRHVAEVEDFEWIRADNVLPVTRDGQVHYIQIEDADLARAMKNLQPVQMGKALQALARVNRFLAMVNTSLRPEFVITNFERDLQTAMINLSGEQSAKLAAQVAKGIPTAMRGIRNALRGKNDSDMAKWYARFKAAGGQVGYLDIQNIEQTQRKIQELVKDQDGKMGTVLKYVRRVGKFIGDYNTVVENAVRLSAFKVAIENGMSEAKAASLAKNLTVNFNRKGELGPAMNALYLFFNAGVQGSARIITGLKHKRVRRICYSITALSFALAEMNRTLAGDDDDDENRWDKVSDYTKHTNLILMRDNGDAWKIRTPYGYNLFVALGYELSNTAHYITSGGKDGKSPAKATVSLFKAAMNAFNPLGGDDALLQLVSPTILDPFVQVATNENFMGSPIKPEQPAFGPPKPESQLYWNSVRPVTKAIAKQLNELTGGSSIEPGAVDISPEVLDHFFDFWAGGIGRDLIDALGLPEALMKDEELPVNRIPFARQVYQEKSEHYDRQKFYDNLNKVQAHFDHFKQLYESGRHAEAAKYRSQHAEVALGKVGASVRARLNKLRQARERMDNLDNDLYGGRINHIDREMKRLMMLFNRKYNQTIR